ncbi:glutathione S-transferase N-terminal domain-containing protein [Pseudooceanicola nanhaiensis]|uniref:glutathione S-transferase N-terminal domain-containing protein n=1 Tax=Pseudooceanicola nanhaiensis TaxID=375761 RepID=UPI003519C52A
MKLLARSGSSAAYRCRIALNLKGIAAEIENLPAGAHRDAAYLSVNPQGRIPALLTDEGALVQSMAILDYLDELVPDPSLLPEGLHARARARGVAQRASLSLSTRRVATTSANQIIAPAWTVPKGLRMPGWTSISPRAVPSPS